ncbi:calmodulin-binding protein 25-like [Miscanthus floridulus]|uniref:calmodulin-binding protein 25-like n=1 Tax=Miscanthus floridulus TaxID=154761 RepID=UPI0034582D59
MANRCAGLDPTWAHLPTPPPTHTAHAAAASHYYCSSSPAWLTSTAAFENEALTSALRASMAPAHAYSAAAAAASSFSSPATPSSSTTSSASELLSASSGHDAPAPAASSRPGARALAGGPRGGRVTKNRKPRPSRRPQTTYITADPANFRRMVQEITGLPVPGPSSFPAASEAATVAAPNWTAAPACVLPTLDTSAFLLDRAAAAVPSPEEKSPAGGGQASTTTVTDAAAVAAAAAGNDDDSSALLELEALVCGAAGECGFPTLESWGMII